MLFKCRHEFEIKEIIDLKGQCKCVFCNKTLNEILKEEK